jgi:REP element-mobilizing transposase RayT
MALMSRPLRIEYPGAVYHVTARGDARRKIFCDDKDRLLFLGVLASIVSRFHWLCHAYCLMNNHYHLIVETPEGNLSRGMRHLNGVYTQRFNRRHRKPGHVFQGRYKAIVVEKESYLLELCRYVVLNPVRAKAAEMPEAWNWSSYQATAGYTDVPEYLTVDWILSHFAKKRKAAQKHYREFVLAGSSKGRPWDHLKGQIYLGDDPFVREMKSLIQSSDTLAEVPRIQRYADRPELKDLFYATQRHERNEAIIAAHVKYGYTLSEIGRYLGIHYTTVSKIIKAQTEY